MSGPKLVGLTCDPEVIACNQERLKRVGKEQYFGRIFRDLNIDIQNVESWIDNYAVSTLSRVPEDYGDPKGIICRIMELKKEHISKVDSEVIQMSIIKEMTAEQLNDYGTGKVKNIPKWKKQFITEISKLLRELQYNIEIYQTGIRQREAANSEYEKRINEIEEESKNILKFIQDSHIRIMHVDEYFGDSKNILHAPQKKGVVDPKTLPFSLDELALIEMFKLDIEEFSKCPFLEKKEKKLIENLIQDLGDISKDNSVYPMSSKRAILNRMRMNYQSLSYSISELTAAHNAKQEKKSVLVIEYISFCEALEKECSNYDEWSIEELQNEVEKLRLSVEKQEERIYIEESVEDIMEEYGYTGISSHNLHDAAKTSQIIFEDKSGAKIATSFGDGMVLMHVVGEGENVPTPYEVNEQIKQQEAFCTLYPKVKEKLKQKGISIESESLMPVSEKHVSNIKIDRQKDIKKSTKRFSFRHIPSVTDTVEEKMDYMEAENRLQYMNQED